MTKFKFDPQQKDKLKKPTQKIIALTFGVTERTVRNWSKRQSYKKLGRRPKAWDPKLAVYLNKCATWLSKGVFSTQQEIVDLIYKKTGQKINQSTISRILKRQGFTRKKITYHYAEQLTPENQVKIKKFVEKIPFLSKSPMLAIDECSFHLNEVPRYGYAKKGQPANRRKPGQKGDNHTLILCIQNVAGKGVARWKIIKGGMKSEDFHQFLTNLKLSTETKHYLLMDNLKVHHATKSCQEKGLSTIKELLASKNIEPEYLPPYTPELNPVELCFNFLRQNTEKKKPKTTEELKFYIHEAMHSLLKQDLNKYFKHCWDYFKKDEEENNKQVERFDIVAEIKAREKICLPPRDYPRPIYPSHRWRRLGEDSTKQDHISAYRRINRCILKSWELANL